MYNAAKAIYKDIDARIKSKSKAHKKAVNNRKKSRAGNKNV